MRTLHKRSLMSAAIGAPRSLGSPVSYPGDWSHTGAIVNDFMRTTLTQGDDGGDPNFPMVHQYHPELNKALQPTKQL